MKKIFLLFISILLFSTSLYAQSYQKKALDHFDETFMVAPITSYDDYKYSTSFFYGKMSQETLLDDFIFIYGSLGPGDLYSFNGEYQLSSNNSFRRFMHPLVSNVALALNLTYQDDPSGDIYEINPYIDFRWTDFPWDHKIITTFAIGEGVSWASMPPARETRNEEKAENATKFLNYLVFEVTLASPKHPNVQWVYRIHHRSGVFGLYSSGVTGSTAIQMGIRYRFND